MLRKGTLLTSLDPAVLQNTFDQQSLQGLSVGKDGVAERGIVACLCVKGEDLFEFGKIEHGRHWKVELCCSMLKPNVEARLIGALI